MKLRKILTFTAMVFIAVSLIGCGNRNSGKNGDTAEFQKKVWGDAGAKQSSGSAQSSAKQKTPDEKELNEIVKKQLWKDFVLDSPFEIVDISANWVEKTAQSCSGDFSVNLRAKENLYGLISVKEGLEKLGIKNLYEGELKQAEEKTYKLPEPYKTNLRNEYPQDRLDNFHFAHVICAKGSPDSAGGIAELSRYGNEWNANVRIKKTPKVDRCIPESGLNNNVKKIEAPETKKTVEDFIQKRKNYVAKVDATIADLNKKHEDAMAEQRKTILEFCQPGLRYDGSWQYENGTGRVSLVFEKYESNKEIITGYYFCNETPQCKHAFSLAIKPPKIMDYPITGKYKYYDIYYDKSVDVDKDTRVKLRDIYGGESMRLRVTNGELNGVAGRFENVKFNFGKPKK
ncbi:MAG: hypothetical protein LBT09_06010 [Planctomycetaceae bacterium]|jgi:hypothetical protein|nr:hypothetical protein [Planctomycetaceae bacterium]